jgi:hypothetical protein
VGGAEVYGGPFWTANRLRDSGSIAPRNNSARNRGETISPGQFATTETVGQIRRDGPKCSALASSFCRVGWNLPGGVEVGDNDFTLPRLKDALHFQDVVNPSRARSALQRTLGQDAPGAAGTLTEKMCNDLPHLIPGRCAAHKATK